MKSFEKPTDELVESTIPKISSPQHAKYFFERLDNPYWIEPLKARGFFSQAPSAEQHADYSRSYSQWPESEYLARMAPLRPELVARTFSEIATDNVRVIYNLLQAASKMPSKAAAILVPRICAATTEGNLWIGFDDAVELCVRLSNESESESALRLADGLFNISDCEAVSRLKCRDSFRFIDGLRKVVPVLARKRPKQFLKLLLSGLRVIADAESHGLSDPTFDGSTAWRPAIEEHRQNRDYSFESRYVGCVREALESAIRSKSIELDTARQLLETHRRLIFKRLTLHLVKEFGDEQPELPRATIMDHAIFADSDFKHEYAKMCERHFSLLSDDQKATWLSWIETGPDMAWFDEWIESAYGRAATDADRKTNVEYWQFQRLHWVQTYLDGAWRDFYERMYKEHGKPKLSEFISEGSVHFGWESPLAIEELSNRSLADVIKMMLDWKPDPNDFSGPSIEGLAGTFKQFLLSAPERFVQEAGHLKISVAAYVRTYINTMTEAADTIVALELSPLIDLCRWVVQRPVDEKASVNDDPGALEDPNWQWTRDSISELLEALCRKRVSLDYRKQIWSLISILTNDSEKSTIVRSADEDVRVTDFALLSINSPCGKAMRAAFEYARWVADSRKVARDGREVLEGGFDENMPEVRALLDSRLQGNDAGGFTVRVMYGWYFTLLNWIDKDWLTSRSWDIFDLPTIETDAKSAFGWAAWNTFLWATRPHVEYYRVLREQFSYAVDQAKSVPMDKSGHGSPFDKLAEHVIILYGRGDITLDDDNAIVMRLLRDTDLRVRTSAIRIAGEALWRDEQKEDIPDAAKRRLMNLWDWYWENIGENDTKHDRAIDTFGYWFASGVLEPQWALERLEQFLQLAPNSEPQPDIVEKLAAISHVNLPRTLRILECLIDADDEGWRIYSWRDQAKAILAAALKDNRPIQKTAEVIINQLGRRNFVEFGDLLTKG